MYFMVYGGLVISLLNLVEMLCELSSTSDKTTSKKKKGKQIKQPVSSVVSGQVDHGYLACQHHRVVITGLAWIQEFFSSGKDIKAFGKRPV